MKRSLDKIIEDTENKIKWYFQDVGTRAELLNKVREQDKKIRELDHELDLISTENKLKQKDLDACIEKINEFKSRNRELRDYKEHNELEKPQTKMVYICSPLRGNIRKNQANAKKYCKEAIKEGFIPLAPHIYFTQFLNDKKEDERNIGMKYAMEWLRLCDELWVYGKPSSGMQKEIDAWGNKPIIKKEGLK